jgi:hypothetical protein
MPESPTAAASIPTWLALAAVIAGVIVLVVLAWILFKTRALAPGDVFRASRLSRGNRIFPTQVLITPSSVVHYEPHWIGHLAHSIHIAHVASVSISTNLLFSDVYIETTGGTTPIKCRGHRKRDAVRMKELIEQYQTAYYRETADARPSAPAPAAPPARPR